MDCSTPGFPVFHYLPESAQICVHWIDDAIWPSHPFLPSSPAFNLSQHQGLFQWVGCLHQVAKLLELWLQHQSFQWIFRVDFLYNPAIPLRSAFLSHCRYRMPPGPAPKETVCVWKLLSHVRVFATPQALVRQASLTMGFSRQEYWSGLLFPSPGIKPRSPALQADSLPSEPPWPGPQFCHRFCFWKIQLKTIKTIGTPFHRELL